MKHMLAKTLVGKCRADVVRERLTCRGFTRRFEATGWVEICPEKYAWLSDPSLRFGRGQIVRVVDGPDRM
jgi:hypothetical protein